MKKIYNTLLISFFVANLLYLVFNMLSAEIYIQKTNTSLDQSNEQMVKKQLPMPRSGTCAQGFEDFDTAITTFLDSRGFDCATLAVIKDGNFLVKRSYGWSDKEKTTITLPDDYLRIASLTKIFTAIAIKNLIQDKKISYQTKVLDYLGQFNNLLDPRMKNITLFQLLFHQGGWDADRSLDPLLSLGLAINKLQKPIESLTSKDLLKYVLENLRLDFIPGTNTKYSNMGYLILGRIIEKASDRSYLDFINTIICKPLGAHVEVGSSKLSLKSPKEIKFYKSFDINLDSDSISLKAADSTFGLITSAPSLCKVLNSYWIDGDQKTNNEHRQMVKTGTLPGTMALARQRYSGATIVVLINSRDNNTPELDNNALRQLIDNTANKCGI